MPVVAVKPWFLRPDILSFWQRARIFGRKEGAAGPQRGKGGKARGAGLDREREALPGPGLLEGTSDMTKTKAKTKADAPAPANAAPAVDLEMIPLSKLVLSPKNVRKTPASAEADAELYASILEGIAKLFPAT